MKSALAQHIASLDRKILSLIEDKAELRKRIAVLEAELLRAEDAGFESNLDDLPGMVILTKEEYEELETYRSYVENTPDI